MKAFILFCASGVQLIYEETQEEVSGINRYEKTFMRNFKHTFSAAYCCNYNVCTKVKESIDIA